MKIQILSDLHLEFFKNSDKIDVFLNSLVPKSQSNREVLIIAGDLAVPENDAIVLFDTLKFFNDKYQHVIYVPGNHEYYNSSFNKCNAYLKSLTRCIDGNKLVFPNVHVANNRVVVVGKQRFLCTTLWFNKRPFNAAYVSMLNDFSSIEDPLDRFEEEGRIAHIFLDINLRPKDIVITHHLPTHKSISNRFKGNAMCNFFLHDNVEGLFNRKPVIWVHGHTHDSFDYKLNETRIICNPYGYVNYEENPAFSPQLTVEVD